MKYIKVFGAEASGSKFLINLLKLNVKQAVIFDHELGSSYGIPLNIKEIKSWFKTEKRPNQTLIRFMKSLKNQNIFIYPIIIITNPYLWYKRINNLRGPDFDIDREFEIYNSLYNVYKDLLENFRKRYDSLYEKGLFIKYEELLKNPKNEINRIVKHCNVIMNLHKHFKIPKYLNDREKEFYLKGPPWKLNEIELINIQTRVDWHLMKYYGYYPINIEEAYKKHARGF